MAQKVYVYSISNGWAKISLGGIYRYVSADYLPGALRKNI